MGSFKDLSGKTFGRLQVLGYAGSNGRRSLWACKCACGVERIVKSDSLVSGRTTSCGCRKLETSKENCAKYGIKPRHGMTGTPEHKTWMGMIERCTSDKPRYSAHFGRGITVCERWMQFENFFADMGHRPSNRHSLDRINNDGDYEPGNCRWAVAQTQQRNRRKSRFLIVDGVKKSLMEVAAELGMKKSAAQYFFSFLKAAESRYESIKSV